MIETLYTVQEVAKVLQVNDATVRNWCRDGRMKCRRLGPKTIRIDQSDLQAYLDSCHTATATEQTSTKG